MNRLVYVHARRGDEHVLSVRHITKSQDTVTQRREWHDVAVRYFRKAYGSIPYVDIASTCFESAGSIEAVKDNFCPGDLCSLCGERPVSFRGSLKPTIVLIGEAPGEREAALGKPFVGRSGKLLDWFLKAAHYRHQYAITNTVLCRPPHNREPERWEKICCLARLLAFLDFTRPRGVILVGNHAASLFAPILNLKEEKTLPINCLRSLDMGNQRFLRIYHPAYFLRQGGLHSPNKEVRKLIQDTVWQLTLFKEMVLRRPSIKRTWSWFDFYDQLASPELKKGDLLVPADRVGKHQK